MVNKVSSEEFVRTTQGKVVPYSVFVSSVNRVLSKVFPFAGPTSVVKLEGRYWICTVDRFNPQTTKPVVYWVERPELENVQPYNSFMEEESSIVSWT